MDSLDRKVLSHPRIRLCEIPIERKQERPLAKINRWCPLPEFALSQGFVFLLKLLKYQKERSRYETL